MKETPDYCPYEKCLEIYRDTIDPTVFNCKKCLGDDFPSQLETKKRTEP